MKTLTEQEKMDLRLTEIKLRDAADKVKAARLKGKHYQAISTLMRMAGNAARTVGNQLEGMAHLFEERPDE